MPSVSQLCSSSRQQYDKGLLNSLLPHSVLLSYVSVRVRWTACACSPVCWVFLEPERHTKKLFPHLFGKRAGILACLRLLQSTEVDGKVFIPCLLGSGSCQTQLSTHKRAYCISILFSRSFPVGNGEAEHCEMPEDQTNALIILHRAPR